jgi:hypothetical protein
MARAAKAGFPRASAALAPDFDSGTTDSTGSLASIRDYRTSLVPPQLVFAKDVSIVPAGAKNFRAPARKALRVDPMVILQTAQELKSSERVSGSV